MPSAERRARRGGPGVEAVGIHPGEDVGRERRRQRPGEPELELHLLAELGHRHARLDARRDRRPSPARPSGTPAPSRRAPRRVLTRREAIDERRARCGAGRGRRPGRGGASSLPRPGRPRRPQRPARGPSPRARRRPRPSSVSFTTTISPSGRTGRSNTTTMRGSTKTGSASGRKKPPATHPCGYELCPKNGIPRSTPERYSRSDESPRNRRSTPSARIRSERRRRRSA